MVVVDEFKVREREFLFEEGGELVLDGLGPLANEYNEFVDVPGDSTTRNLGIVSSELRLDMFCLGFKVFFSPNLTVQLGVVDEGNTFFSCLLNHLWRQFLFANTKELMVIRVVPENSHTWHLFIVGCHVLHLGVMVFIVELSH